MTKIESRCATIALTGGIASGKSTVTRLFQQRGAIVFDADVIARDLVASGTPALAEIAGTFGDDILTASGELDRRQLRERIFADADARRRLEAILHPRIRIEMRRQVASCTAPCCLLAIPLLAESYENYTWVDRVLVIDVPRDVQIARLMQRDGMTLDHAQRMLDAQTTREQRLALADDVIDNSGPLVTLDSIARKLHRRYLALVDERKSS
jgi:dephospho-CoA kinase